MKIEKIISTMEKRMQEIHKEIEENIYKEYPDRKLEEQLENEKDLIVLMLRSYNENKKYKPTK